jgi:putative transposase
MRFRLIEAERAQHAVSRLCAVLGVTRAGFYAWRRRPPSARELEDRELSGLIERAFRASRETYGVPHIHAELRAEHGVRISRKRVARLMRRLGIEGVSRRGKRPQTTRRAHEPAAAEDLVRRRFRAPGPDRLWVADITYVPTWEGYLFLAVVIDAWSRRLIGWSMRDDLRAELVLDALGMALTQRRPEAGLIHHSDRGSQGGLNRSSQQCVGDGTVRMASDGCLWGLPQRLGGGGAAVVAEARPEGGPERR